MIQKVINNDDLRERIIQGIVYWYVEHKPEDAMSPYETADLVIKILEDMRNER